MTETSSIRRAVVRHRFAWFARHARLATALMAAFLVSLTAASPQADARESYALIIANKTYRHTGEVRFAERDAAAIESALVNVKGVRPQNIFRFADASVGDLTFLFGVEGRAGRIASLVDGEDAHLYVYFAGHGSKHFDQASKKSSPFLLGVDSRPEALPQTAYALDTLVESLKRLQRDKLTRGRVTLILEACFSGRSNDGDLIKNRSAPAFGPAVTMSASREAADDRFVMMAAAQGDQFAVWDDKWQRSVFTDALVSGLYGEADDARFAGNNDGKVTLGELNRFVKRRIARRLQAVQPGERQDPDIIGGTPDMTLASVGEQTFEWPDMVERQHVEKLRAAVLLASPDTKQITAFLKECLYCPKRDELRTAVREASRKSTLCTIEERMAERMITAGDAKGLETFISVSQCATARPTWKKKLASLRSATAVDTQDTTNQPAAAASPEASERKQRLRDRLKKRAKRTTDTQSTGGTQSNSGSQSTAAAGETRVASLPPLTAADRTQPQQPLPLATAAADREPLISPRPTAPNDPPRRVAARTPSTPAGGAGTTSSRQSGTAPVDVVRAVQSQLRRHRCLTGKVDGVWGRQSTAALRRFLEATYRSKRDLAPTANMLATIRKTPGRACTAAFKRTWKRPQG
ncbi:MAG: caspase family protein [Pseudomonadota bacterium]